MRTGTYLSRSGLMAFTLAFVLVFFCSGTNVFAQNATISPNKWMLEVAQANEKPWYFPLSEDGRDAFAGVVLSDGKTSADNHGAAGPQLELTYRPADGALDVEAKLRYRPEAASSTLIGRYVLTPDESVTLSHLSLLNLTPVMLRLVSAQPDDSTGWLVADNTASLIVEDQQEDRSQYKIVVRNISPAAVVGVVVSIVGAGGAVDMHRQLLSLPSGAIRQILISKRHSPSDAHQVRLDAALFDDGSYEGSEAGGAILEARYAGQEEEERRITGIVEKELEDPDSSDGAKIRFLNSQLASPSNQPDPSLVNSVLAKFPDLTSRQKELVAEDAHEGLGIARAAFTGNLKLYEIEKSHGQVPRVSLKDWWQATRGRCDIVACSVGSSALEH